MQVTFVDDKGQPKTDSSSHIPEAVVRAACPFQKGNVYRLDMGHTALQNIFKLGLFDNVQINP